MRNSKRARQLVVAGLLIGGLQAGAETVILSGVGQMEDTYLRGEDDVNTTASNYGGSNYLIAGALGGNVSINGLMRFTDFSSVSGQMIASASLRLLNTNHGNQTGDVSIEIHELVAANGDWVEGTAENAVQPGSSCWRFKFQNTEEWVGGRNGAGVAGVDYTTHLVGSAVATNTTQEWVEFALDPSVVQGWIDDTNSNYGIVLTAPGAVAGEAAFFASSETGTNSAPQLVIELSSNKTYAKWAEENNLAGDDALRTSDPDTDGMENLLEYALGGDPKVDDAATKLPVSRVVEDSGTNWFGYIYNRRLDAAERSLDYGIILNSSDLVLGAWVNIGTDAETGTAAIDVDFESVTNIFSTVENQKFINLEVTEN